MKVNGLMAMAAIMLLGAGGLAGQKLSTRHGEVRFFSETKVENIEAVNKEVSSVLDFDKGQFAFLVPIKSFVFEKALMQEHFNENYMESDKFPKATFKGTAEGLSEIDLSEPGSHEITFSGTMEIHGVENQVEETVQLEITGEEVKLSSKFFLRVADYEVEIPSSKRDNISEDLEITVNINYEQK